GPRGRSRRLILLVLPTLVQPTERRTAMPAIDVLDSTIHYEAADGGPFVFLHGNPTSSHAWRHVLPRTGGLAPDLIGMGRSGQAGIAHPVGHQAGYPGA